MEAWKIVRDRSKCERPGCPLSAGGEYFAVLELPSCQRRDLCEPCFREEEARRGERPLFWRGRRRESSSRGPVLDLASLRMLFDRLGEPQPPERADTARGLRYIPEQRLGHGAVPDLSLLDNVLLTGDRLHQRGVLQRDAARRYAEAVIGAFDVRTRGVDAAGYHEIAVRVNRANAVVTARRGYQAGR